VKITKISNKISTLYRLSRNWCRLSFPPSRAWIEKSDLDKYRGWKYTFT